MCRTQGVRQIQSCAAYRESERSSHVPHTGSQKDPVMCRTQGVRKIQSCAAHRESVRSSHVPHTGSQKDPVMCRIQGVRKIQSCAGLPFSKRVFPDFCKITRPTRLMEKPGEPPITHRDLCSLFLFVCLVCLVFFSLFFFYDLWYATYLCIY